MKKILLPILLLCLSMQWATADDAPSHPRVYIDSFLETLNDEDDEGAIAHEAMIARLDAIVAALPSGETALSAAIASGRAALVKMQAQKDDSDFDDFARMARDIALYVRTNEAALKAAPASALSVALKVTWQRPHRQGVQLFCDDLIYVYCFRYSDYSTPIPAGVKQAAIDSLEWVTRSQENDAPHNTNLVYIVAQFWDVVQPRLATMTASQRELVLDELEVVLAEEAADGSVYFGPVVQATAKAKIALARATYPDQPGGKGDKK
jgi:hypothetical protein